MIKALKLVMIILMILGVTITALNFISVDNMAFDPGGHAPGGEGELGTQQQDGCYGEALNCVR